MTFEFAILSCRRDSDYQPNTTSDIRSRYPYCVEMKDHTVGDAPFEIDIRSTSLIGRGCQDGKVFVETWVAEAMHTFFGARGSR